MEFPAEILCLVAENLGLHDLGKFRLTCRRWSETVLPVLVRKGLTILNVPEGLQSFQEFSSDLVVSANLTALTILHCEWPVCSRAEWAKHPLLFSGNDRFLAAIIRAHDKLKADKSFARYCDFLQRQEAGTRYLCSIVHNLKSLEEIVVRSTLKCARKTPFQAVQKEVWMSPALNGHVACVVQALLSGLESMHRIRYLTIDGCFNADGLYVPAVHRFNSIRILQINKLRVGHSRPLKDFLSLFPCLTDLDITYDGWTTFAPEILNSLFWPHLRVLRIADLWASELEIYAFIQAHRKTLSLVQLVEPTLTQGSWQGFFTMYREYLSAIRLICEGELFECNSLYSIEMNPPNSQRIAVFLRDCKSLWPFQAVYFFLF